MENENKEPIEPKINSKIKTSSTLAIVIFSALFLIYNSVLQQILNKEITYMADLVSKTFYIFMLYITGNKAIKAFKK